MAFASLYNHVLAQKGKSKQNIHGMVVKVFEEDLLNLEEFRPNAISLQREGIRKVRTLTVRLYRFLPFDQYTD